MKIKKIAVFAVSLAFVFTSVAFAGGSRLMVDHSDLYAADPEWVSGREANGRDIFYRDHSFRHGVEAPESEGRVRGYYKEGVNPDTPADSDRPLGFPLDRHPQLDVFVPEAGHPPYGPGA